MAEHDRDLASVEEDGMAIQRVRDKTRDLCLAAVKQNGVALLYVPKGLREDYDICLAAVKQNGSVLPLVPDKFKQELAMTAVEKDGLALQYVQHQTHDLCMAAINQNAHALRYVKDPTIDLCLAAVKKEGWVLGFVPKRLRTLEICMEAVNQNKTVLGEVPDDIRERVRASFRNRGRLNTTSTSGTFGNLPDVLNPDPDKLGLINQFLGGKRTSRRKSRKRTKRSRR